MKKNTIILMAISIVLILGITMAFAGGTPGTTEDPLVSRSYVDSALSYKPLELKAGQSLIGGEGCEIIPRSGFVTALAPQDGLADVTAGNEIKQGYTAPTNHLMIVSRSDGRGIKAQEDSWILVRGKYTIQ
ncbi:MAG: hypothetical protein ACTTH0_02670 [Eubacteriales bacterium]